MHGLGKLLVLHFLLCLGQTVCGFKIIHGEMAPENSMQYMVSIQNKSHFHQCGGFLITEDFVVTAAHCDEPKSPIHQIFLGSHSLKGFNGILKKIDFKCKPSTYRKPGLGDDIMLLKLSGGVHQSNRIKTVPLPTSKMNLKENEQCSVAGWGRTTFSSHVNNLRVANVSIINPTICSKVWGYLPSKVICAGGYETYKGFCQGDSGGPLICQGKPVGVVSFNYYENCDYPNKPNVYTDLSEFLPWINKILREKKCV